MAVIRTSTGTVQEVATEEGPMTTAAGSRQFGLPDPEVAGAEPIPGADTYFYQSPGGGLQEVTPEAAGSQVVVLPTVSVAPVFASGLARLVEDYEGPLTRIVRSSDSATLDVAQNDDGKVDMVAANAFRGASETVSDIAYDQSSGARHALQTTNANRPRLRSQNAWHGIQGWTHDSYVAATAGTKVSKHFTLPAGVSIDRSNATVFIVAAPRANYQQSSLFEIGTTATNRLDLFTVPATAGLRSAYGTASSPTVVTGTKFTRMDPEVYVIRTNATNAKIHNGDNIDTLTKPSSGALTGGQMGGSPSLSDYGLRGEIFAMVVYPSGLSDADVLAVKASLREIFAIEAMNDYLVFEGDSLTEGIADTHLFNMPRYVADALSTPVMMANSAVYGVTAATTYARRVALWDGLDRTVTGKKIAVIGLGINDISAATTGANLWTNSLQPYIAYVKSRGYDVIVSTLTPSKATGFDAAMETQRLAVNTLIRDNAAGQGYVLADYCAHAIFDAQADADNTTYYTADKVHHTSAAFLVKADIITPLVEALLAA